MNIKHTLSLIASVLLLLVVGCTKERFDSPSQINDERKVTLTLLAPEEDASLKAAMIESEGTLDLQVRFRPTDKVSLFVVQDNVVTTISKVRKDYRGNDVIIGDAFKEIAEDGTVAKIDFTLPANVDLTKPMTLIGYSGINQNMITNKDNKLLVYADNQTGNKQEKFNAPVVCRIENFKVTEAANSDVSVRFQHIGCYEIIHFTNKTADEIDAKDVALTATSNKYDVFRPWSYTVEINQDRKKIYPHYNLVTGDVEMIQLDGYVSGELATAPKVAANSTESVFSWYIPKDVARPERQLNYKKGFPPVRSEELLPANPTPQVVGKAYHAWGYWDGTKLTLTNSKGEAKPKEIIEITTNIEVGKLIEIWAYVAFGGRDKAFIDLNGNGVKDGAIEAVQSMKKAPYIVAQPKITFHGAFEVLRMAKQKITSVIVSPVAKPTEFDLTDNEMDAEALNAFFKSLPDISDVPASILVTKKLSIKGNPGAEKCDINIAMKKGWIVDVIRIDPNQPSTYLIMNTLSRGRKLYFSLDAAEADRDGVWIDLNGNAIMDEGEKITKFGTIDVRDWSNEDIIIYGKITSLNLSYSGNIFGMENISNTSLINLDISNNGMQACFIKKSINLETLNASGNIFHPKYPLDITPFAKKLKSLNVAGCGLKSLDLSKHTELVTLNVEENQLGSLDLSNSSKLTQINAKQSGLSTLKINAPLLESLDISSNDLNADALNAVIEKLPDLTGKPVRGGLWIALNPGTSLAKVKVALDKFWSVDVKGLKGGNSASRDTEMPGEVW